MHNFMENSFKILHSNITANKQLYQPVIAELSVLAEDIANQPAETVTDKTFTRHSPSRDLHDYVSIATYWWPNPDSEDGLPYFSKDGELSPDFQLYDRPRWEHTVTRIITLIRSAYFLGNSDHAEKAVKAIRKWFLAPATRMNPHLCYAQMIPGKYTGRPFGIIDAALYMPAILFHISILQKELNSSWNEVDQAEMTTWCRELLSWLQTHEFGEAENNAHNNHGTHYDILVVSLALFTSQTELAKQQLHKTKSRISQHIEPDGTMPRELKRTCSFGYFSLNLRGLLELSLTSREINCDICVDGSPEHKLLQTSVSWLNQFACSDQQWPYEQIEPIDWQMLIPIFDIANELFDHQYPIDSFKHRLPENSIPEAFAMIEPIHPFGKERSNN